MIYRKLSSRGTALVITLAFVTILSIIVLAYFNVVSTDRKATRNYSQGIQAEEVGQGAMDFIIGQLRAEMAFGDTPLEVGNYKVFTNVDETNILPEKVGEDSAVPALVKMSLAGQGLYENALPGAAASEALSSSSSLNGRRISPARWALPGLGQPAQAPSWFLLGLDGIAAVPSRDVRGRFAFAMYDLGNLLDVNVAGFPSNLAEPQRRQLHASLVAIDLGAQPGFTSASADALILQFRNRATAANPAEFVKQVAKAEESGFMKVASGDDMFLGRQDLLSYAKKNALEATLRHLTTFTRSNNAPGWFPRLDAGSFSIQTVNRGSISGRNALSGASTTQTPVSFDYKTGAADATRQNRAMLTEPATTAFPRVDGTVAIPGEPLVAEKFPLERLQWLSKEGPSSVAITKFESSAAAAAKIKAAFGLVWDSTNKVWVYTSPVSTNNGGSYNGSGSSDGPAASGKCAKTIKTLAVVATENREPDFFELLQVGILRGSVGERSSIASPTYTQQPGEITPEGHILQVGANIIDQSDADDFPTLIRAYMPVVMQYDSGNSWEAGGYVIGTGNALTPHDFAGVENLPYLLAFRTRPYRTQVGSTPGRDNLPGRPNGEAVLMPQFWNPHQNAATPSADRPARLRVVQTFGSIRMAFMNSNNPSVLGYGPGMTSPPSEWPSSSGAPQPSIEFRGSLTFEVPSVLVPADVTATSIPENKRPALVANGQTVADIEPTGFVGFWLGRASGAGNTPFDRTIWNPCGGVGPCPAPYDIAAVAMNVSRSSPLPAGDRFWKGDTASASNFNSRFPVFEVQYLDGTTWKTYQRFDDCFRGAGADHTWDALWTRPYQSFTSEFHARMYSRIDPRGSRFGLVDTINPSAVNGADWNGDPHSYYHTLLSNATGTRGRPAGAQTVGNIVGNQCGAEFTTAFHPSSQWTAMPIWQWINNSASGQRATDCDRVLRRADADSADGVNPLSNSGGPYRPIVLNRPFTSVGDLGYVFRDLPFKTLDLFSAESADAALLDLFCVKESAPVAAGKLSLNCRNTQLIKGLLRGTIKTEADGNRLTDAEADQIANALIAASTDAPFTGLWDLPAFLASEDYSNTVTGDLSKTKSQMESVPRALAGVADTRCWNLLIDVIAQSGRYTAAAPDPEQFIVEGERRYWLQIAIDRFTGEIVDQQLEPVSE